MGIPWFWAIFGALGFFASLPAIKHDGLVSAPDFWVRRAQRLKLDGLILQRAKRAFANSFWREIFRTFLPGLAVSAIYTVPILGMSLFSDPGYALPSILCFFGGLAATVAAALPLGLSKLLKRRRELGARTWASRLATIRDTPAAVSLLLEAARHPVAYIRGAAVLGLRELNLPASTQALESLAQDPDALVKETAAKALAMRAKVLAAPHPTSLQKLPTLISNHKKLENLKRPGRGTNPNTDYEDLYNRTEAAIDEIVYSQLGLRGKFPHIYCQACLARAEQQHFERWEWVRCLRCEDAVHLVGDVEKAIGVIGADAEWDLREGTLRLSLWNAARHQARAAEIETLEIRGGTAMDYDWAVSAVVEKLQQGHLQLPLEVRIVDTPPLSVNSLRLLQTLDPKLALPA